MPNFAGGHESSVLCFERRQPDRVVSGEAVQRKPFLKWAGGKYRILDRILRELPVGARFVEPFAGSCAVYLNVSAASALVCDINADLINLYQHLQREGEPFIRYCQSFFTPANNTRKRYLGMREAFNSSREPRERGALFLYLNRHAFNGLVRYNSRGTFNVPFGTYKMPYFPLKELRDFHAKTQEVDTVFACRDFRTIFAKLRAGDVVYCDPPYVPLSGTASFTAYAGTEFTAADQRDLAALSEQARHRGITIVLSNHNTAATRQLYAEAELTAFDVQRFISCHGDKRTAAPELLAVYK